MNKQEYADYLSKLIEDFEFDPDCDPEEQFFAYFQCFMPYGEYVEKVFEPLPCKTELYERLCPIYKATESKTLMQYKEGCYPGYFCPPATENIKKITEYANQHIASLKEFASFLNDNELLEMLNNVTDIKVSDNETEIEDDDLNAYLYDAITEWGIENIDDTTLISILSEAYYSINCDYYLAYYFQYPTFREKLETDFLKPYFNIWKSGYHCKFDGNKLNIYK
ncbi:MAG: hypothetical protein LBV72_03480 [Tannerella sp.]|jgi:hypothetical protein|nr:hypothetical protein [Tannerella sp.]